MKLYALKINGKYVKKFREVEESDKHSGGWWNHSKRSVLDPVFCEKEEAHIIAGRINLRSYMERIDGMVTDGYPLESFCFEVVGEE